MYTYVIFKIMQEEIKQIYIYIDIKMCCTLFKTFT